MAKSNYKYVCGVPSKECSGSIAMVPKGMEEIKRAHSSPSSAFACHSNYLIKTGFDKIGPREFRPKNGGPIRILTKQSRFGAKMRGGKRGEKGGGTGGNRNVPEGHGGGIISSL